MASVAVQNAAVHCQVWACDAQPQGVLSVLQMNRREGNVQENCAGRRQENHSW